MVTNAHSEKKMERLRYAALKRYLAENKKPEQEGQGDSLTLLRNLIFFVAIYLYFTGWTYSYYLYSHFGVSLYSLDIPFYYFFIYSYSVIFSNSWWLIPALGTFLLTIVVLRDRREARRITIFLFLLVFFPLSFKLARTTAFESALLLRKGYGQTVKLVFRETERETLRGKPEDENSKSLEKQSIAKNYPEAIINANKRGELRLLTQTKDRFFVLYQPEAEKEVDELPMCFTYIIASADISLFTIEAQNTPDVDVEVKDIPR